MGNLSKVTTLSLVAAFFLTSCGERNESLDQAVEKSETIIKIDAINASLPEPINDVSSRGILRNAFIVSRDIEYAGICGVAGYKIGGFLGGLFGTGVGAAPGAMIGAFVGGAIGAIGGSYDAYMDSESWDEHVLSPEDIMEACEELVEDSESEDTFEEVEVPDSIERIGYIHNLAMDALIKRESSVSVLSNDPPFLESNDQLEDRCVITFTQFEKDIITSDSFKNVYYQLDSSSEESEDVSVQVPLLNQILYRYIEAMEKYRSPLDYKTVVSITNQYISVVRGSTELLEDEKTNLYIAFAVGVYSFKYWSNFESDTAIEEE